MCTNGPLSRGLKLNLLFISNRKVQEPVDPLQTGRQQHVFKPSDRLSALTAISEEGPLHGTREGDKEGIQLFIPSG